MKEKLDSLIKEHNIGRDTFFERIVNFFSRFFFDYIHPFKFFTSPNQITLLGLILGVTSFFILFNFDNVIMNIISAVLLFLFICCDYIDGDFARLENKFSTFGKYLDSLSDLIILFLIIFFNITEIINSKFFHFSLIGLSIMPLLLKASNKQINIDLTSNIDDGKVKKNSLLRNIYNNYFRPTFTNIVCYFIIFNLFELNILFCVLIGISSIALFINNQIKFVKK